MQRVAMGCVRGFTRQACPPQQFPLHPLIFSSLPAPLFTTLPAFPSLLPAPSPLHCPPRSFIMNCQELATAKVEGLATKVFILNNQYLGMVMQWEDRFYKANRAHTYLGSKVCVWGGGGGGGAG